MARMIHPVSGASGRAILPPMAQGTGPDRSTAGTPPGPSRRPRVGVIGAGNVGTALGVAIDRAGWPVVAVSSRDPARRAKAAQLLPGARPLDDPAALVELVDLVLVTVPDDVIGTVAAGIRLRPGQAIVHTSGALPADILAAAQVPGTTAASFHPLVPFADVERALAALPGASIAIEGDPALVSLLSELATDLGARPIAVSAAGKAAYHAAAALAAGGVVALLDVIAELGRVAGMDERTALAVYAPLIRSALGNAEALGIANALTGPVQRGDAATIRLHLDAIDGSAPATRELYVAALERQLGIAMARGDLDDDTAALLRP